MKYKQVFNRMIEMERASAKHPNLMQTYEVIWKALKEEIQFDKILEENLTKHNSRTIQSAKKKKLGEERGKQFLKSLGHGKSIYEVAD